VLYKSYYYYYFTIIIIKTVWLSYILIYYLMQSSDTNTLVGYLAVVAVFCVLLVYQTRMKIAIVAFFSCVCFCFVAYQATIILILAELNFGGKFISTTISA